MSYWKDRMASSQTKLTNKSIKQIEKQMKKYYGTAMKKTIADFEATYPDYQVIAGINNDYFGSNASGVFSMRNTSVVDGVVNCGVKLGI